MSGEKDAPVCAAPLLYPVSLSAQPHRAPCLARLVCWLVFWGFFFPPVVFPAIISFQDISHSRTGECFRAVTLRCAAAPVPCVTRECRCVMRGKISAAGLHEGSENRGIIPRFSRQGGDIGRLMGGF